MLTEAFAARLKHRGDGINHQLCCAQVGWRGCQMDRRKLKEDEEMIREHRLDRGRAQVGNLFGFVDCGVWIVFCHSNNVAAQATDGPLPRSSKAGVGSQNE